MKRKILLSLIVIVALFTITGCGKSDETKETKSKNKTYECRYSKDDTAEGKRYLNITIVRERIKIPITHF